jgi:hypothetical protein
MGNLFGETEEILFSQAGPHSMELVNYLDGCVVRNLFIYLFIS